MKWNEWGFRPPLCTYRINWAMRTPWGWWDEWDDTALQTQDSKFKPWRSQAEHATSRSRRLPTILNHYEWAGKKHFVSLKLEGRSGVRNCDLRFSKQAALTTAPGPPPGSVRDHPSKTRYSAGAGLISGQRRRLWSSIKPASDQRRVFAGYPAGLHYHLITS